MYLFILDVVMLYVLFLMNFYILCIFIVMLNLEYLILGDLMICFIYLVNSEFLVIWLEKWDIDFNDLLNIYLIFVLKYLMCNIFL